jgi:hypothetical protein
MSDEHVRRSAREPQAAPDDNDQTARGQATGAADQDEPRDGHPVTTMLRSDAVILMLAHRALNAGDGSAQAQLAARRTLDSELRDLLSWPSGDDYARAADDYDRLGRPGDAALLRRVAATDKLLADARTQWNTRYDDRPPAPAQELIALMRESGLIDFDPAGPLTGTDGAFYEPGAYCAVGAPEPIVVITGRGGAEFIVDWPGFDAMHAWVASRGTTAVGGLAPPPMRRDCRAWEEDLVLARLVTSPRDVRDLTAGLRPDTFTTDVRYEVYGAVLALSGSGDGYYTPGQVASELTTRLAAVPPYALAGYGGPAGLFTHAYLARLAATRVTREKAASTAATVIQEDDHYRARAVGPRHATEHETAAGSRRAGASAAPARQEAAAQAARVGQPDLQRPGPLAFPASLPGPSL